MKIIGIALFAWYSAVAFAAPAANNGSSIAHTSSAQEGAFSGKCNGTSCKIGLINYKCNQGSCTGPGGGDGAYCYARDSLAQGPYICPGAT